MRQYRTLDDIDVEAKRVLIRLDLNVPMRDGRITDMTRIDRILPTLTELLDKDAGIIVLSHFGRPNGKVVPEMSLKPVAEPFGAALGKPVRFIDIDWAKPDAGTVSPGDVVLLENTRFHPGEESNDPKHAAAMAALGEIYVNDAFSVAHRAHASTEGVAHFLPAAAGRAMQAELDALGAALQDPKKPVLAVVGGAKISSKLDLIGNLSARVDGLIIGGGMANTFLAARGVDIGKSLCEHDLLETARRITEEAASHGCEIILPVDAVVATEFAAGAASRTVTLDNIASDDMVLDIGPESVADLNTRLDDAATLVWNGPLGAFEIEPFDAGTNAVARHAANLTRNGKLVSVAGGGDTVAALAHAGAADDFTYVSTAGGAFLEWLEGKDLPGVKVLRSGAEPG
jgi:phosphoglycerate kinase